jgi:hypothetical protein
VVILDPGGEVVEGKGGGFRPRSPAQLRKGLKKVQWLLDLEKAARENPDDALRVGRWVLVDGYRRDHAADLEAMRKAIAVPGMDAELVTRFVHFEKTKPIADLWHRYEEKRRVARTRQDDAAVKKARAEAMAGIYELYRSGTRLEKSHDKYYTQFWGLAFSGALQVKDRPGAEDCLAMYTKKKGKRSPYVKRMREQLTDLDSTP